MSTRFNPSTAWPPGYQAMQDLSQAVDQSGLDPLLLNLVYIRASQINGCAFCLDLHTKDAIALGEDSQRLHLVAAWREAARQFDERERAALALTEALTLMASTRHQDLDQAMDAAAEQFPAEELPQLVFAIGAINSWNRLTVASGRPVGGYRSPLGDGKSAVRGAAG